MDKEKRIRHLEEIKDLMIEKKNAIERNEKELDCLRKEYDEASKSVVPLLLFKVNNLSGNSNEHLYVYYEPDFDRINYITHDNLVPQNTLDFTRFSRDLRTDNISIFSLEFDKILEEVVNRVKLIIENAFSINDFESWEDVYDYLKDLYIDNEEKELKERVLSIVSGLTEEEKRVLKKVLK